MSMTRMQFVQRIAATFAALPMFARRKESNVWDTPQGQYVLMLRAELERLGHFDDLKEDWDEVERALREGCKFFEPRLSRIESSEGKGDTPSSIKRVWWRVVPIRMSSTNGWLLSIDAWGRR